MLSLQLKQRNFTDHVTKIHVNETSVSIRNILCMSSWKLLEMWTDFRNNPQLLQFSHSGHLLFLKVHDERLVHLVHLFISDFATGHKARVVTSQFFTLVSHRSSIIRLMVLVTQLTVILHAGSQVTYDSFLNHRLYFSRLSRTGRRLLRFESVILLVCSLYTESIKALKSRAAIPASFSELIRVLGKINSETRL
jgi:hypothetical protein